MALKVAEVLIRWRQEGQQQVVTENKKLEQSFTNLGNKAKAAGAVLTAGLTAPLVLIGKQAVDAASDLNEATSAVNTVFGETANQMVNFSRTAASNLGQSRQAALSAASALGALFKGVGLNEQQMADFSSSLLTAAADLGSFYNVDPGQALQNLRSGLVGEAEPLRRFGILINAAAVEAKGLELGLVGVDEEMTEGQKVQARYALIMEQLGAASGDFARTSDGLANQQRILAARMQDVRAEIGNFLLPYALQLSGIFSRLIDRFLSLDEHTKKLAVSVGALAAAAGPLLLILGQILPIVAKLGPAISLLLGPVGLLIGAVTGLGLAFKENWFGIRDLVGNVIGRVGNTLGRMVQFFQHAKERGLTPFRLAFRTLIVSLGEQLGRGHPVVDFLKEVLRLGERLDTAFKTGGITAVVDELTRQVPRLENWFSEQFTDAKTFGAQFLSNIVESLRTVNWSLIGDMVREGIGTARDWLGGAGRASVSFGAEFLQSLIESLRGVNWDAVGIAVRSGLGTAGNWLGGIFGGVETFGAELVQTMFRSLQGVNWDLVVSEVRAGVSRASETVDLNAEPGWQKMLDDLMANTRKEFEFLRNAGTWANDNFIAADWNDAGRTLQDRGIILATELWRNTQGELGQLKQVAGWVKEQLEGADWRPVGEAMAVLGQTPAFRFIGSITEGVQQLKNFDDWVSELVGQIDLRQSIDSMAQSGSDLVAGMLQGMSDKFEEIINWIGGGGEKGGLAGANIGDRIHQHIAGSFVQTKDKLLEAGKLPITYLWEGAKAKWEEFTDWFWTAWNDFIALLPTVPNPLEGTEDVAGKGRRKGGLQPDTDITKPAGSAYGGTARRRFTMVGEYGPELLINRQLVMPHGAAQSRVQAMGGMAMGGTGSWREWLRDQDNATRQAVQELRSAGRLNRETREALMLGLHVPGLGRARHDVRNRRKEFQAGWSPETGPYRNERERRRLLRQAEREAERARDFGDSGRTRDRGVRADRQPRSRNAGDGGGGTHFHFSGPVRFEITKPDIAAEISRQLASYRR